MVATTHDTGSSTPLVIITILLGLAVMGGLLVLALRSSGIWPDRDR
jgi:hypothetical protein